MPENIFPGTNLYPLCISMFLKQNKYFVFSIFRDVSFKKQMQQLPWWIDFAKILPKMCLKADFLSSQKPLAAS